MHEFAVAENMVEVASESARAAGAVRVRGVSCRIGALCHIDAEALREAFGIAGEGTLCDGAVLRIERGPLVATCRRCGRRFCVEDWHWTCTCGGRGQRVQGGTELEVTAIEVEIDDENDTGGAEDPGTQRCDRGRQPGVV